MRIGINTGGGDAPGLNAVIHAVVLAAHRRGWEVHGIHTGYVGLLDPLRTTRLTPADVESIVDRGGTLYASHNGGASWSLQARGFPAPSGVLIC